MDKSTKPNKLISETSPYLLQHAYNPVNWYPWGSEALEKAKQEDKVVLVSIGYSACHWCHVMERESFEDATTAAIMNTNFICIKIDREERPDLDHIYMDAVQAMTGSGGWPLNVFLTPDTKPFYGGTYFPPVNAFNRSSWTEVLGGVSTAWKERKHELLAQADNLTAHIGSQGNLMYDPVKIEGISQEDIFKWEYVDTMFSNIMKSSDTVWGGFGKAPKFPQTFTIEFLFQYYHYTGNLQALEQALLSVDKMLQGGIYDHVAGGLARYSTDNEWLAPHFEKMLYDNALLINVLCSAFQITKKEKYKIAAEKTIEFVLSEMTNPEHGFYAALDADSEGEEGKYYVWQKSEIDSLLGENSTVFCNFFNVTQGGNWEHKNILRILEPIESFAPAIGMDKGEIEQMLHSCLRVLESERVKRTKPALDDKSIAGWNALMLKALATAAIAFKNNNYLEAALANFNFISNNLKSKNVDAEMLHTWKSGTAKYPGFLDDYAYFTDACIRMYEATFLTDFLEMAQQTCKYVCANFSDEEEVFFYYTHLGQKDIIVRKKEIYDGAVPSGNSVMAANLLHLSIAFDDGIWRQRAYRMLQSVQQMVIKYPGSFGVWAALIAGLSKGFYEIAVTGKNSFSLAKNMVSGYFLPNSLIMASEQHNNSFVLLADKKYENMPQIYLCKKYICNKPVYDLAGFENYFKYQL